MKPPFARTRTSKQSRAQTLAREWEDTLASWHKRYLLEGKARIDRHHEGTTRVNGVWVKSEKGAPDFGGTLAGGRSVVFEAKLVLEADAYYMSKMQPHQRQSLLDHARMGGLSMVLVRFVGRGDRAYLVVDGMAEILRCAEGLQIGMGWHEALTGRL